MQSLSPPLRPLIALARLLLLASASLLPLSAQTVFEAARNGDLATVQQMVTKDRSLVARKDAYGLTPLHWAAARGKTDVAAWLLDHGAKVDALDTRSFDVLREEAEEQSRPPEREDESRGTGFGVAEPLTPSTPPDAHTPLHWAAACGHLDLARLLLDRGASVKAADRGRMIPLHYAAEYGHADIVALLMERGAPVNAESIPGYTPLLYATLCDWPERRTETLRTLLRAGADPRADGRHGARVLTMAANHGHADALSILLEAGADPNTPDERGYLPIHQAANILDPVEPMRVLLAHGALPDPVDSNRCTPLLYLRAGGLQAVRMLVDASHSGMRAIAGLVEQGALRATVAGTFPLAEAAEAHRLGGTGRTAGKLVLLGE